MGIALAALMLGVAAAAGKCDYSSCLGKAAQFKDGDAWGDLATLKTRKTMWNKDPDAACSCTGKYEAAPANYTAAYSVTCAGRLEDQAGPPPYTAKGMDFKAKMFAKGAGGTVAKCAERCKKVVGCGGFIFNFYDDEMSCEAIGVNDYCKGTNKKGDENKDYPDGPGKDKGLLTSRDGRAVYMLDGEPLAAPKEWEAIPASLKAQAYKTLVTKQTTGGTVTAEDICIASTNDANKKKACSASGGGKQAQTLNSGSNSAASIIVLAAAAASALKLC